MHISFEFSLNRVVKFLVASDLVLAAGWGFIGPIFAIYLTEQIKGGDVKVVGFAAAVYWIVKSLIQPFIARHLDRNHGEVDDFYFLAGGLFVAGLVPLAYLFIVFPWQLYIAEAVHAIAMACVVPTWSAIFTRHIDRNHEAFDWSIESTAIGFGAGFAGAGGGAIASLFGFPFVFVLVSIFTMFSVLMLFPIRPLLRPEGKRLMRPEFKR